MWRADELLPGIDAGTVHLAEADGSTVGTMTLHEDHDEDLWTPADDPASALYLSHLGVVRSLGGHGIGAWMLAQATHQARRHGKRWLRLDARTTNTKLHAYYRQQGFHQIRTVDVPGNESGALFQRPTTATLCQARV
jgi:GNAT superfamily N-acetyltransferase